MHKKDLLRILEDLFREELENSNIKLNIETERDDIVEWDSISHLQIIDCIEKTMNIKFSLRDITEISSIKKLINTISEKQSN